MGEETAISPFIKKKQVTRHGKGGWREKTLSWSLSRIQLLGIARLLYFREINLGIWSCGQVWACRRSLFPIVAAPVCYWLLSFHRLTWTGRLSHVRPFVYVRCQARLHWLWLAEMPRLHNCAGRSCWETVWTDTCKQLEAVVLVTYI